MTNHHPNRHRAIAAILTAVSLSLLTGCTDDGPLPPAERPNVVWENGQPTGPLEDNPWVQAVRASDLELRIAHATRDFSNPALGDTSSSGRIFGLLRNIEKFADRGGWAFPPGPTPMVPIYVEEAADGKSAAVLMCTPAAWEVTADQPEPEQLMQGRLEWYDLVEEDGHRKVDSIGAGDVEGSEYVVGEEDLAPFLDDREDSDCNLDDAKIGLFDPQPDVTVEYTPEDIKTEADE